MLLKRFPREFYSRPTLEVARGLIGAVLVDTRGAKPRFLRIVEVEAYIGEDDPACHAACGRTERNAIMYGPPGVAYVYLIYGMYHCLNVVTEPEGFPAAVLIRAAEPLSIDDISPGQSCKLKAGELEINPKTGKAYVPNGPGKLTLALGVNLRENGVDLTDGGLYVADRIDSGAGSYRAGRIQTSPRIGISKGQNKHWRLFDAESNFVSGKRS